MLTQHLNPLKREQPAHYLFDELLIDLSNCPAGTSVEIHTTPFDWGLELTLNDVAHQIREDLNMLRNIKCEFPNIHTLIVTVNNL